MKVAMTLDGRIAPPPASITPRDPYWITCEAARAAVQPLRWQADAAMVGVDTVLADDPLLTDRSGLRRRRPLQRVVLDSALRMPLDCKWSTPRRTMSSSSPSPKTRTASELELRRARRVSAVEVPLPRRRKPAASRSARFSTSSAKKASSPCSPKPARVSIPPCSLPASSTAFISSSRRRSWAPTPSPPFADARAHPHGRIEVERYDNDLGLCSLLRDPWQK